MFAIMYRRLLSQLHCIVWMTLLLYLNEIGLGEPMILDFMILDLCLTSKVRVMQVNDNEFSQGKMLGSELGFDLSFKQFCVTWKREAMSSFLSGGHTQVI